MWTKHNIVGRRLWIDTRYCANGCSSATCGTAVSPTHLEQALITVRVHTRGEAVMIFKIKQATSGQWYFNIMSGSNILATSETYVDKSGAKRTAQVIIDKAASGTISE
jgi:uncharacterized protein YegP (UPF0339 family)